MVIITYCVYYENVTRLGRRQSADHDITETQYCDTVGSQNRLQQRRPCPLVRKPRADLRSVPLDRGSIMKTFDMTRCACVSRFVP